MSHFRNKTSLICFKQKVVPNCNFNHKLNSSTVSAFDFFDTTIVHGIFRYTCTCNRLINVRNNIFSKIQIMKFTILVTCSLQCPSFY